MNDAPEAGPAAVMRPANAGSDWLLCAAVTLLVTLVMLALYGRDVLSGLVGGPEDAMRITGVRDLLGGQGWFDTIQTRLSPPGVAVPWSRLVDLPIAVLVWFFSIDVDPVTAERLAVLVWPLVLLAVALMLVDRLARQFIGGDGVLLVLAMVVGSTSLWATFAPGRLGGANVAAVLDLAYLLALARSAAGARPGAVAGFVAAGMLAVGPESLPWIAAGTAWLGLVWAVDPSDRAAAALRAYGVAAAFGAIFLLIVQRGPYLFEVHCDSLSIVQALGALLGSMAIWVIAVREWSSVRARLMALVASAAAVAGLVLLILPACADDIIRPAGGAGVSTWLVAVLGAAAGVTLALRDAGRRAAWALVAAIILLSLGVGLVSGGERVVLPATLIATLPIAGLALSVARNAKGATAALAVVAGFFLGSTLAQSAAVEGLARLGAPSDVSGALSPDMPCFTPLAAAAAAALPPGLVLAPAALGPDILYLTPHSVRASPFGRSAEGIRAVAGLFAAVPEEAHRQAIALGGRYLFFCRTGAGTADSDSLAATLERGEVPPWLLPVASDEEARIRLFRILPES